MLILKVKVGSVNLTRTGMVKICMTELEEFIKGGVSFFFFIASTKKK
jgi:hypothetical protein